MNITDSIYFDGETLNVNTPSKLIYKGILTEDKPEAIYMHCGYGLLWEKLHEIKLVEGVAGYEADVTFSDFGDYFFCFRSSTNGWDNNFGANYVVSVNKPAQSLIRQENTFLPEVPKLKTAYLVKKKIKVAFYRTISAIAKLFSGEILRNWLNHLRETRKEM